MGVDKGGGYSWGNVMKRDNGLGRCVTDNEEARDSEIKQWNNPTQRPSEHIIPK